MKKNLVKLAAFAVVSVMGMSMLAACGGEAPSTEPDTKQEQSVDKTVNDAAKNESEAQTKTE